MAATIGGIDADIQLDIVRKFCSEPGTAHQYPIVVLWSAKVSIVDISLRTNCPEQCAREQARCKWTADRTLQVDCLEVVDPGPEFGSKNRSGFARRNADCATLGITPEQGSLTPGGTLRVMSDSNQRV